MFLELKDADGKAILTVNLEQVLMVSPAPAPPPADNAPTVPAGTAIHFASGAIVVPLPYEIVADAIQDAYAIELEDVTPAPAGRA